MAIVDYCCFISIRLAGWGDWARTAEHVCHPFRTCRRWSVASLHTLCRYPSLAAGGSARKLSPIKRLCFYLVILMLFGNTSTGETFGTLREGARGIRSSATRHG